MRRASRTTASVLGLFAGGASIEHGIYEILQGHVRPEGPMINSMGPPCQPDAVWHRCEPAMTILPSFLITGILAVAIGVFFMLWSLAFVQRKGGGLVMILSSIPMLLFGGGIFPPLIGIVAGAVGARINRGSAPGPTGRPGALVRITSRLWPWTLIVLMGSGFAVPILIIGLLVLSPLTATAHDRLHSRGG
jgi:hypothetical protein